MKHILISALIAVSASAMAEESAWVPISSNADGTVQIDALRGSGKIQKNDAGEPVYVAQFRVVRQNLITNERRYVRVRDCAEGFGRMYMINSVGEVTNTYDFNTAGNAVGDAVAAALCDALASSKPAQPPAPAPVPAPAPSTKKPAKVSV